MKNGSHRQKNAFILELMNLYCHVDADLNFEHCVADGTWINAVEILEKRLKHAILVREQQQFLEKLEQ